eukprot:TRINITY_DN7803_c0_g1_i1.p1 TRINITY_DN7803_c0_g1~~TRINITY_DN7803_c0_g1_i1.p1  ORF type:complete len:507 (+),score=77.70 TRINITY_DN7803_c0_g1_i1:91-1611(+)
MAQAVSIDDPEEGEQRPLLGASGGGGDAEEPPLAQGSPALPARGTPSGGPARRKTAGDSALRRMGSGMLRRLQSSYALAKSVWDVYGPGLVVMLADVDAGSIVTAAESGREWGYSVCVWNFGLFLPLYFAQELTVRVGATTGLGFVECARKRWGPAVAWIVTAGVGVTCFGAIVGEMSGLAGIAEVAGLPGWVPCVIAVVFLIVMTATASHKRTENVALFIGAFEIVFFVTAWITRPSVTDFVAGSTQWPITRPAYRRILAANLGAVIMPWMVFYQQSSVAEKGLTWKDVRTSRAETLVGAVIAQGLMAAIASTAAAARGVPGSGFRDVPGVTRGLGAGVGPAGVPLTCMGVLGGALVGAIVSSLAAAWAAGEAAAVGRALATEPHELRNVPPAARLTGAAAQVHAEETMRLRIRFVTIYALLVVAGAAVPLSGVDTVKLNVAVQVLNSLFAPIVLWMLFQLASSLPDRRSPGDRFRLCGWERLLYAIIFLATGAASLVMGIGGMF